MAGSNLERQEVLSLPSAEVISKTRRKNMQALVPAIFPPVLWGTWQELSEGSFTELESLKCNP